MGSSWVPFSVGCLPPPHWMGLVLFCLQLETPQEGQVWRMEHHTSGGKCREEGRRNQALCPVPCAPAAPLHLSMASVLDMEDLFRCK